MKLVFTPTARRVLLEIGGYIARDSRVQALRFSGRLERFCASLVTQPKRCPLSSDRPERGIRRAPVTRTWCSYRVSGTTVTILRVLHAARDIEPLLDLL